MGVGSKEGWEWGWVAWGGRALNVTNLTHTNFIHTAFMVLLPFCQYMNQLHGHHAIRDKQILSDHFMPEYLKHKSDVVYSEQGTLLLYRISL